MSDSVLRKFASLLYRAWEHPPQKWARLMQMTPREREFVADIIRDKSFLELGSGYSTLWFSRFAARIVSVETREKWFLRIQGLINRNKLTNVELILLPPEPCAYDDRGNEKWKNRNGLSDYGRVEEFTGYLQGIQSLLKRTNFDVVLVDGNIRHSVVELLCKECRSARILLHDVLPERDYLNNPILGMVEVRIVNQIDTLVELSCVRHVDADRGGTVANESPSSQA